MPKSFNQTTRIREDQSERNHLNNQNSSAATYMLNNYHPECPAANAREFATNSDLNFNGSHQVGIGGCNIDQNSAIFFRSLSRDKCRLTLSQRQFVTIPFMGRGTRDATEESKMQQGDIVCNRKTLNPSSEVSYLNYSQTPLLPSLEASLSKGNELGNLEDGFVRGGIPSRELTRDKDID